MNHLGIALVWCALQVSVLGLIAAALYASARRWGPTARSHIALAGMVLVLALTACAFSPWPRWQFTLRDDAPSQPASQTVAEPEVAVAQRDDAAAPEAGRTEPPPRRQGEQPSIAAAFWTTFVSELGRPQAAPPTAEWRWPFVVAALFLAGAAFGTARLLAGGWAVRTLRRRSKPIHDPAMLGLLDVVQAELSCRRPIELRESSSLVTAATIGWRKPLILLPAEWPDWTEAERHAVLAHEIAHIGRHDFAAWIFAECGLVLHFYHPLVHWLAGRLRLEQELAADAAAAAVTGGQRPYLTTLAAMALRQPDRPLSWPARTFLPTRRTFLRRIEMLRDSTILTTRASAGLRFAALGLLFLAGLGVAGLRGPVLQAQNSHAQPLVARSEHSNQKDEQATGLTLKYIPRGAIGAAAARVSEIYTAVRSPQLDRLIEESQFEKQYGLPIPLDSIRQVTVVFGEDGGGPIPLGFIVTTKAAGEARKMLDKLSPGEEYEHRGRKYVGFLGPEDAQMYLPDDRTVIVVPPNRRTGSRKTAAAVMTSFIDASLGGGAIAYDWMKSLQNLSDEHAAVALDVTWVPQALVQQPPGTPAGELAAMLKLFSPLWLNTRTAALGVSVNGGVRLEGIAHAIGDDGAQRVEETVQAVVTLAHNLVGQSREQIAAAPAPERQLMSQILTLGEDLLRSAKVTREDRTVRLQAKAEGDGATALIAAQVFPTVSKAREAAQRTQSMNNLKQIGLAMHNYYDVHGQFPPAVVMGPDGKTPRSWRVELLPFLDRARLYNDYRKDEPWDSEHNKKILEQMPAVFGNPKMFDGSTTTAYFVLTGPKAPFSSKLLDMRKKEGPQIPAITDGTSNTIMTVEAKRDIPWTKPEDIPYELDKPLPELGGFWDNGWLAGFFDGRVRFISSNIDETVLRGLITPAGGEIVGNFSLDPQP